MNGAILQDSQESKGISIDPRTKFLLLFVINLIVFANTDWKMSLPFALIPMILLVGAKKYRVGIIYGLMYLGATLITLWVVPETKGALNLLFVIVSGLIYRMSPGLLMGYYLISTTTVSEFVAAMERMKISQKIIIPLSVMFRFFPTVKEESDAIKDAMRMRGVGFGAGKKSKGMITMLEYRLVPLLMSTVKIGDELSQASLTRGLGSKVRRTNICEIGFHVQDVFFFGMALAALVYDVMI